MYLESLFYTEFEKLLTEREDGTLEIITNIEDHWLIDRLKKLSICETCEIQWRKEEVLINLLIIISVCYPSFPLYKTDFAVCVNKLNGRILKKVYDANKNGIKKLRHIQNLITCQKHNLKRLRFKNASYIKFGVVMFLKLFWNFWIRNRGHTVATLI